jgi:ATP-dependent DNA ligase
VLIKVKHERTCDCVVAGFRLHKDGAGVGSLLLGLYDDEGSLHHVGVAASLDAKARVALLEIVEPLGTNALGDHPWREWAKPASAADVLADRRMPGGTGRWNATKDMSWEPMRIELVAEVAYEGLMNGRFRHNARLRHLRADRDPASCTYSQLEVVAPAELQSLLDRH